MPDLLIISNKPKDLEVLSEAAINEGFRVKVADDVISAKKWASTRSFDLLIIHEEFGEAALEELSTTIWSQNGGAQVSVYNQIELDKLDASRRGWSKNVLGADYFYGQDVIQTLMTLLQKVNRRRERAGSSFKVLVVEDIKAARDIICSFVEHLEYAVAQGVGSGQEALDILRSDPHSFSCILTDINMPGMPGWELIERVRSEATLKHIPIIALTAYGTPENLMKCLQSGASGFLVKPPSKAQLSRELSRAKRIILNSENPRLVQPEHAEIVKDVLADKGYV
jgi:two-component system chemotaxis response regulator CheY